MNKLKVAIIGLGKIAQLFHLPAWMRQKDCQVYALCDTNNIKLKKISEQYGIKNCFLDYTELLNLAEIDIIDICTPNVFHAEQTIHALNKYKNVLVEKPLALTEKQSLSMRAAAKKNNRILMCAQHQRFRNVTIAAKKIIDSGKLGEIYHIKVNGIKRRVLPNQNTYIEKKYSGGGVIFDLGAHLLDAAWWLIGCPKPESVYGTMQTKLGKCKNVKSECGEWNRNKFDIEEVAAGIFKFHGDKTLVLELSYLLNSERDDFSIQFCGTKAGLKWPELILTENVKGFPKNSIINPGKDRLASVEEIKHFVECIRKHKIPMINPEESVTVVKMLENFYKSAEKGSAIAL